MQAAGFIWDLDNTLYRYEELTKTQGEVAAARVGEALGVPLSHAELRRRAARYFDQHGNHIMFLTAELGCAEEAVHHAFHELLDVSVVARRSEEIRHAFAASPARHVILTHASRVWATRMLVHIGLKDFFPDSQIIPLEDVQFQRKSASEVPFTRALEQLGCRVGEVAVIEDTLANLRVPAAMGLYTVYIHHGQPLVPPPEFVSQQSANAVGALQTLAPAAR